MFRPKPRSVSWNCYVPGHDDGLRQTHVGVPSHLSCVRTTSPWQHFASGKVDGPSMSRIRAALARQHGIVLRKRFGRFPESVNLCVARARYTLSPSWGIEFWTQRFIQRSSSH